MTGPGSNVEFEIQALANPVLAMHRSHMDNIETTITHAYDAATLCVKDGKITRGQTLNLDGITHINLNASGGDWFNIATPTFTGSTLESVLRQFEKKFPQGLREGSAPGGAPRFFVGKFDGGAILIAHPAELETRLTATLPPIT
jgi:hypothetical protein